MNIFSELRTSRSARISLTIIIAVAAYYGLLSYITPWTNDEMAYMMNFASDTAGNSLDRIDSIGEILESQISHYENNNGRFVTHFFVQLFCGLLGHGPFAIFNIIFFIAFILMVVKLSGTGLNNSGATATVLILTILSFQTKIAPSCYISYFWMYTLIMGFIWFFFNTPLSNSVLAIILTGILSFTIGNTHESLNIGVSAALIIYWYKHRKSMSAFQYVMFICFGLGTLSCCLAPGTINRASTETWPTSLIPFGKMMFKFLKSVVALYILIAVVCSQHWLHRKSWREIYASGPFYWNALIVLLIFNFWITIINNRQFFGVELLSIILSIRILKKHALTTPWFWTLGAGACLVLAVQTEYSWRFSKYFKEIERQYQVSDTGEVYVDINDKSLAHYDRYTLFPIPYYNLIGDNYRPDDYALNYDDRCIVRFFKTEYPGHPPIKVLPSVLKGKRNLRLPNQVIEASPGYFVVIQDKSIPSDIIVSRSVDLPGFHKTMPDENISNPNRLAVDADYWCAYIYDISRYATYGRVTDVQIKIVPRRH